MHIEDLLRIPQVRDTLVRHYSEGVRRARENYARHAADDNSVTGGLGQSLAGRGAIELPNRDQLM